MSIFKSVLLGSMLLLSSSVALAQGFAIAK